MILATPQGAPPANFGPPKPGQIADQSAPGHLESVKTSKFLTHSGDESPQNAVGVLFFKTAGRQRFHLRPSSLTILVDVDIFIIRSDDVNDELLFNVRVGGELGRTEG